MHDILENEINLLQPQIPRKQKCGIITTLLSSFIGLAYEGISSFLHHMWNKALHKAVSTMNSKANIQHNKLMQLEISMLMYGVYNVETLEKLITTIHNIHNTMSSHERLFAGQYSMCYIRPVNWFLTVSTLGGSGSLEITDFYSFYFRGVWWSWKNRIYWFSLYILHVAGFEEPTMSTAAEAAADSPQNPEEESPVGNPNARLPSQTRGGVTNYADHHRCWGRLP